MKILPVGVEMFCAKGQPGRDLTKLIANSYTPRYLDIRAGSSHISRRVDNVKK
jgi:hypothetical protein